MSSPDTTHCQRSSGFSISRYSGVTAAALWTLTWVVAAYFAGERLLSSRGAVDILNVFVALACVAFGCWAIARSVPNHVCLLSGPGPWSNRVGGWFAVIVWCIVATLWNTSMVGSLVRAAISGHFTLVVMIPFSLIGLFLLITLFTCAGVAIDSLLQIGRPPQPTAAEVSRQA